MGDDPQKGMSLSGKVQQAGAALELAADVCRCDREIVLAAVKQQGTALEWAAEVCRSDREIVLAAVAQNGLALQWAGSHFTHSTTQSNI
eukprot:5697759-Amphidinium_carterae.1